jgi:phenylalanyl-tRNA synthetase beta chain
MAWTDRDEDAVTVEVPGYRVDVEREVDLIEEIVRIQGYERVGSTLPPVRQAGGLPASYAFRRRMRRALAAAGLRETWSIPFVSDADLERFGDGGAIRVTNPLQADEGWLRTRLLPGLLKAAARNLARHVRSVALFETSATWRLDGDRLAGGAGASFVIAGPAEASWTSPARETDVFDAKGAVEALLDGLGVAWTPGSADAGWLHAGRSASVLADGEVVGVFGELHPRIAAAYDLSGRVAVAELDAEALERLSGRGLEVRDVPRFPPVRRDLAFVVDAATPAGAVREALAEAVGEVLGDVTLFDVHVGPPLPTGKKSLAFSVDLRAADRTLTDVDANDAVARIADRLAAVFGAELRSG